MNPVFTSVAPHQERSFNTLVGGGGHCDICVQDAEVKRRPWLTTWCRMSSAWASQRALHSVNSGPEIHTQGLRVRNLALGRTHTGFTGT